MFLQGERKIASIGAYINRKHQQQKDYLTNDNMWKKIYG